MIDIIKTVTDVQTFAKQLVAEGVSFHPDDDFKDFIFIKENTPCSTDVEAEKRNQLMKQCFEVSERDGFNIYSIMLEVSLEETGMDKYIPLPSSIGVQI